MKSFFATLRTELVHRENDQIRQRVKSSLFPYSGVFYNRKRYNRKRKHCALSYLSPRYYELTLLN